MTKIYQRGNQNLYIRQHNDQKILKRRVTWTFSYAYFEGKKSYLDILLCVFWRKGELLGHSPIRILKEWRVTPKDTKGAIRNCISDNTMTKIYQRGNRKLYIRQHNDQKIPKGVIRICISDNTITKLCETRSLFDMAVSIADQFKILPTIPRRTGRQINRAGHPADNPSQVYIKHAIMIINYTEKVGFFPCQ
jgi:hypothetical protein